jgi:ADP-L-glycero-D-manno-heptose 6-epimerase
LEKVSFLDRSELRSAVQLPSDVQYVVHLGACTDTGVSDAAYVEKWNTDYTRSLWERCAASSVPFLYASSGATYGLGESGYSDEHPFIQRLKPLNLYGQSKHRFDLWALEQKACPPHWAGLKFFNVYGPNENHKGRMASSLWHGWREIRDRGKQTLFRSHKDGIADGEQKRDFVFVDDIMELCFFHMEGKAPSGLYNCGTGQARTFLDLSRALFKARGKEPQIEWVPTPEKYRAGYQYFTQADMGKTRAAGYSRPFTSLEEGAAAYCRWLEKNGGGNG